MGEKFFFFILKVTFLLVCYWIWPIIYKNYLFCVLDQDGEVSCRNWLINEGKKNAIHLILVRHI